MNLPPDRDYSRINRHCFINAPFEQLQTGLLALFLDHCLQPEIGLDGNGLWQATEHDFRDLAGQLRDHGLSCTLHAPFSDLAPGGSDEKILETTREKLRRAFLLIPIFKPRSIVCHLGYEENKHGNRFDRWLESSLSTWRDLVELAADHETKVMFENTYENTPSVHRRLLKELDADNTGFCLDVGHLLAFAGTKDWRPWLAELGTSLGQLHLHDNNGRNDAHIAIGQGIFDFQGLLTSLRHHDYQPLVTLEPHSEKDLWLSLATLEKLDLLQGIIPDIKS